MKRIFIVIVLLTVISNYSMATTEDNLHWFKDAKFGLFGDYILRQPVNGKAIQPKVANTLCFMSVFR